jgi:hypothetical protein
MINERHLHADLFYRLGVSPMNYHPCGKIGAVRFQSLRVALFRWFCPINSLIGQVRGTGGPPFCTNRRPAVRMASIIMA